jgi:16S rRNA (cytidine1402-2'-O)-methyltransferase
MNRFGLHKPLIAAHQHNEREAAETLIARLQAGERIALVSDAGTPAVSDPGARIVDAVRAAGLRVLPLPGASAAVTALSASGLVNDQFYFVGFLPAKAKQRENFLATLRSVTATMVFYEAPHRILDAPAPWRRCSSRPAGGVRARADQDVRRNPPLPAVRGCRVDQGRRASGKG